MTETASDSLTSSNQPATAAGPLAREVARRRTFGIIAHPDAGKTTLTEKILLYAGRVEEAGAVRGRKSQRAVRSDWMKLEQERGVSVTATCLSFDFEGYRLNLLDTPGHQDFSEDTYRTLNAVDAAVMVVDAVKGIETQTIKLCRICAEREIPILTFVNKMDRPGSDPLGVLTQVEEVLGIDAAPINWPIGTGRDFRGLAELDAKRILKFSPVLRGSIRVPVEEGSLQNPDETLYSDETLVQLREEVELLQGAGSPFDRERFLSGKQTPVFYGSALTNYGVEQFLERFLALSPPPRGRESESGTIWPTDPDFTGIVFKIQANLDPRHRDRVAFVRVCSGRFERDMDVKLARTGEKIRVPRSHQLFAQERETIEEAFAGDVIGIVNPGKLRLGDTICGGRTIGYTARWDYAPESFIRIRCSDTSKRKQFQRGVEQLIEEGAIQLLHDERTSAFEPVLAAVGELQFDVVQFRLESEYNTTTKIDRLPFQLARWIHNQPFDPDDFQLPMGVRLMKDQTGASLLLFETRWSLDYCRSKNPTLILKDARPVG
jgi:peptide chain release factor 3